MLHSWLCQPRLLVQFLKLPFFLSLINALKRYIPWKNNLLKKNGATFSFLTLVIKVIGSNHLYCISFWCFTQDIYAWKHDKYFVTIMILSLCLNNIRKNSNGILIKTWSLRITGIHHINDEINSMKTWSLALITLLYLFLNILLQSWFYHYVWTILGKIAMVSS